MTEQRAPSIALNIYHNLGSKTFWFNFAKKSVTGAVFLILALIISMTRSNFGGNPESANFLRFASWISFAVAVVSLVIATVSSRIIYKNTGFTITQNALILKRGVFKKEEFAIPYRQIQNIEIERSLGDQMLGVSKMIILTAGEETESEKDDDPENILPVIDKEIASALQAELLRRTNIQK